MEVDGLQCVHVADLPSLVFPRERLAYGIGSIAPGPVEQQPLPLSPKTVVARQSKCETHPRGEARCGGDE